jgi:hypothetical protein
MIYYYYGRSKDFCRVIARTPTIIKRSMKRDIFAGMS